MADASKKIGNEWIAFGVTSGLAAAGLLLRFLSKGSTGPARIIESTDLRKSGAGDAHGGILDNNPDPNLPVSAEGRTMHVQTVIGESKARLVFVNAALSNRSLQVSPLQHLQSCSQLQTEC